MHLRNNKKRDASTRLFFVKLRFSLFGFTIDGDLSTIGTSLNFSIFDENQIILLTIDNGQHIVVFCAIFGFDVTILFNGLFVFSQVSEVFVLLAYEFNVIKPLSSVSQSVVCV